MTVPDNPPGHDGPRCLGGLRNRNGLCGQVAGWGTEHLGTGRCKLHGGSTPNHVKAAHTEQLERDASAAVASLRSLSGPVEPITDPLRAMSVLAGEVNRYKDVLAAHVAELTSLRYQTVTGEQLRGELSAFSHALGLCNTVLTSFARLRIDDRLLAIEEKQSAGVLAALEHGLAAAGVDGVAAAIARAETGRHLRLIGA